MTQRDKMRDLYRKLQGVEADIIAAYAEAERAGEVERNSNEHGLEPEAYALALFLDGTRKGWIGQ